MQEEMNIQNPCHFIAPDNSASLIILGNMRLKININCGEFLKIKRHWAPEIDERFQRPYPGDTAARLTTNTTKLT
jgi:hypothetical protein